MIEVSGHSDDLIEIDGDIVEEFYASTDEPNILAFSNEVILQISYGFEDTGQWKISILSDPWNCVVSYTPATDINDNYTDRIQLQTQTKRWPVTKPWVVYGHEWKQAK